jgi:abortive infection bacteriophage resistance protein
VHDEFKAGVKFDDVLDLYVFDKQLRLMLLDAIERIEIALRVDVALHLGKHDSKAHLDVKYHHNTFSVPKYAGQPSRFESWQSKFNKSFTDSREDFVGHFKQKYPTCQLPIWMAVELWDFGMLSVYIDNLKDAYKASLASQYELETYKLLGSWLHTINIVRNVCAHHGRLWNRVLAAKPQYPKANEAALLRPMVENKVPANRLFATMCIIQYFMRYISPNSNWHERMKELMANFPDSEYINHKMMGVIDEWDSWLLWE